MTADGAEPRRRITVTPVATYSGTRAAGSSRAGDWERDFKAQQERRRAEVMALPTVPVTQHATLTRQWTGTCNAAVYEADDLGEEHGHRVLRVVGKGTGVVLVPLPPAVGRAIDRAIGDRPAGPILRNRNGVRMDRHAATRHNIRVLTPMSVHPLA